MKRSMAGRASGAAGTYTPKLGTGRGRSRGGRGVSTQQLQRSPGNVRRPSGIPEVRPIIPDGNPPSVTVVRLSSLADDIDVADLNLYFEAVAPDVKVSSVVKLGEGRAQLKLEGLTDESREKLKERQHKIRGKPVTFEFESSANVKDDQGPPQLKPDGKEEEAKTIKVCNVPDVSDEALKAFFEAKKSGSCSGAVESIAKISPGVFHVTFHDPKVAARVLSEPRAFKKASLELSILEAVDTADQSEGVVCNQIEVSNVPDTVKEVVLKTYFETSKSGGSDNAVSECKKISPGVFHVTFHDPQVAARVMEKDSHTFKKAALQLKFVCREEEEKQRYKLNQLAIHGLPEGVEGEVLEVIIGDRLELEEGDDFSLEVSGDQTAVITFPKDYSVEELQQMISIITSEPVKEATVTVEMCEERKPSLHIKNMGSHCDEALLEFHFSDHKRSGGGEIEEIQMTGTNEAIITFVDPTVIPSVLGMQHKLLGDAVLQEVSGSPPSLVEDSTLPGPSAEPLEIPVDPLLLQSLAKSPSKLEESIMSSRVTFSADEETGMVIFSPTRQSKSSWKTECQEKVSFYISSNLAKVSVSIPKEAAAQVKSATLKLQKSNSSLTVAMKSDNTAVTLAGEPSSVSQAKKEIERVCSAFAPDTASLVLSPEDFDFFEQIKRSEVSDSIKCKFNHDTFQIFLEGPGSEVSKLKESIAIFIRHTDIPVMLDPLTTEFFRTDAGRSKLKKFLEERQCQAALHFSVHPNLTLHLLCRDEDVHSGRAVMQAIPLAVRAQGIPIPESVAPVLSELDDFKQLCQKLETENCVLIKNVGHEISAAGFKPEMSKSLAEINRFLKEKASPLPPSEMKIGVLVAKSLQSNQRNVEKCLHSLHVQLEIDTSRGVLQFSPLHFLMPGWEEACKTSVNEYLLSNVAEAKVQVPQNAYQDIMSILYSMQSEDPTFVFNYPPQSTNLTFAGDKNTVKAAEDKLAQICANFSFKSEEISLKQEDFEFLTFLKMEDLIAKCRPLNIDIESNPESHSLTLAGPAKGLKTAKENVASMTAHVAVLVSLEEPVVNFFTTERGKDKLYNILRDSRYGKCAPFISDSPMKLLLLCLAKHKRNAEKASDALRTTTTALSLQIPDLLSPFLAELPEFVKRVQSLEEKNSVQISVEDKEMLVAGFEDGVTASIDALSTFVKEKMIHFQPLHVPVDTMIAECIEDNPVGLIACLVNIPVNHKIKSGKSSASISLSPTPKTKSGWKEECESILTSFLEKHYLRTEIEVPKTAAGEVFQVLMTASRKKDFKFELCDDGSRAIVAGEISEVQAVEGKVASICTKHQTTEEIQLTDREYDFFTQLVQPKIKNITIECNPAKHAIVVAGSIREVTDLTKSVKKMVAHSVVPVSADAFLIDFFTTSGKQEITAYVNQKMLNVAFYSKMSVHPPVLELLCEPKFEASVRELAEKLPEECQISGIPLPKSIITSPMDKEFRGYCQQLENEYHVSIIVNQSEVKISGFRGPVKEVKDSVESFIKKKCTVKKPFPIHATIWRLFSTHMKKRWMEIEVECQHNDIQLTPPVEEEGKFTIILKGDKIEIQKIIQLIQQLIQSVATHVVSLTRPGIRKFFSEGEKGKLTIPGIESTHKVCIEVARVGDEMGQEQATANTSPVHAGAPRFVKECVAEVLNMKQISIFTGDITEFRADVIVNAANEDLKHIGGVADSVLKKGGQIIQQESDKHVRSHGSLKPGEVWLSHTVGNLPCSALIHAVGPRWHNNPYGWQQLQKVIMSCLTKAIDYYSIALPAISSGIFGCPMDQCAEILISTAVNFCKNQRAGDLQEINFILYKSADVIPFIQALQNHLPAENIRQRSNSSSTRLALSSSFGATWPRPASPAAMSDSGSDQEEEKEESSYEEIEEYEDEPLIQISPLNRVMVQQGSILDVESEIYVNSTNGNMDLSGGAVAQALASAAGPSLQAECSKKAPIGVGEIAVTGPGNIRRCKCIVHINCPGYDHSGGQAEAVLRSIMHKCMKECDKKGASTIVFPAIGTGNLGFPYEVAAHTMVDGVCNYLKKNKCKSLSMVYFIIFQEKMFRCFEEEVEQRKQHPSPIPKQKGVRVVKKAKKSKPRQQQQQSRGRRNKPPETSLSPTYRGRRGASRDVSPAPEQARVTKTGDKYDLGNGLIVEVVKGDITQERTNAIVCPTTREMSLAGGGVSAALLKKAGSDLKKACDAEAKKGNFPGEGKVVATRSGKLKCKQVFHIVLQRNDEKTFTTVIKSCVDKAIQLKYSSIAFPAIGTGMQGFPANEAGKCTISGLQQCHSSSPLSVRIVLFQDDVYSEFKAAFNYQVGKKPGWFERGLNYMTSLLSPAAQQGRDEEVDGASEEESETQFETELRIYGETEENVMKADESLNKLINKQFLTDDIEDEKIAMLTHTHEKALQREARRSQLTIDIDRALKLIQLQGNTEQIQIMKFKVFEVLNEIEKEASRKSQAETMQKIVQWKRMDSSQTPYDPLTNLEIEEAYSKGIPEYEFKDENSGEHFTIHFKKLEETDHTMQDQKCKVKRIAEGAESDTGLPDDWEPMNDPTTGKEVPLLLVDLPVTSEGYKFALGEFHKTVTQGRNYNQIVKIQRIQNPSLYGQYAAKKKYLESHNPSGVKNERWLFHGTNSTAVPQINQTNFNRSFRGQNGTVYGQGTYFAQNSSYSINYAPADSQGMKRMYLVRVLTGEFTAGSNNMIVAPPKDPNDPTVLFDSVVDNTSSPSIFVVFYDADAYPEYLIIYT